MMAIRRATRLLSRAPIVFGLVACAVGLCVQDACVLAEPSGALPTLPDARPVIVHASLVPPESAVLTTFPATFIVPVELIDPTVDIAYSGFIDFNPMTGDGLEVNPMTIHFDPANATGRTRTLTVAFPAPPVSDRCHVIEIVVARRFDTTSNNISAHTPATPPGGDIAHWFYNPNGDIGGCPALDAGIDATTDADSEAGEAGVQ